MYKVYQHLLTGYVLVATYVEEDPILYSVVQNENYKIELDGKDITKLFKKKRRK